MSPSEAAGAASDPRPFEAPWQAQAFGMVVALHEAGHFAWGEWADCLSNEIAAPPPEAADLAGNAGYYAAWLRALEALLTRKGIATPQEVSGLTAAWHRAALATPHGAPITLAADPQVSQSA